MEKLLQQFINEKDTHTDVVSARIPVLKEYESTLDRVISQAKEAVTIQKGNLDFILNQIELKKKEGESLVSDYKDSIKKHIETLEKRSIELEGLEKDIVSKVERSSSLDKIIETLMLEKTTLDRDILDMRASYSNNERINKTLVTENSKLEKAISDKKKEESDLITSIEAKKKEHTSISEDIVILEKRNK